MPERADSARQSSSSPSTSAQPWRLPPVPARSNWFASLAPTSSSTTPPRTLPTCCPVTTSLSTPGWCQPGKSLTVLKPGGLAVGVAGPPDAGFAQQVGAPAFLGIVMNQLSRRVRKQAKALGVRYEFLFMQADGSELCELGALYDSGALRPVIDRTFAFADTVEAMAYVEEGRTKAGRSW